MRTDIRIWLICLAVFVLATGCSRQQPGPAAEEDARPPRPNGLQGPRQKRLRAEVPSFDQLEPAPDPNEAAGGAAAEAVSQASRDIQPQHPSGSKREQADALFDNPTLLRIQIQIPQSGLSALRRSHGQSGQNRPEARAIIREGGLVYTNVAVHLKGAAGSFRSIDDKPAFTLKFDKFAPEQSFHGLHKISLNNSVQDSSYLCEKIARELFIQAGVPAPRASHAIVELNGEYLGLYVLVEGANKQFLKRYFNNPTGNLYDGGFCRDIGSRLAVNSGEDPNNSTGLRALRAAVRDGSFEALNKALDVDRFLSMVALEMMLCHWDGYSFNKNNWRVFHDLESNRMVFIPHGLDQLFGGGRQFDLNGATVPEHAQGEVTRAVLATREGQRRYLECVRRIYTNTFRVDQISARIDQVAIGVSRALAQVDPDTARAFQQRANSLKHRIIRRADALRQQLGSPLPPVKFTGNGLLPLSGWQKSLVQSGEPSLSEVQDDAGRKCLVINSGESASSSSWRTRVVLPQGKYRFEGRLCTTGVTVANGDARSGAGLRISKGAMPAKVHGTTDWKTFAYLFEIPERSADVEFVCELKATGGEARFDAGSLRVVRVE